MYDKDRVIRSGGLQQYFRTTLGVRSGQAHGLGWIFVFSNDFSQRKSCVDFLSGNLVFC